MEEKKQKLGISNTPLSTVLAQSSVVEGLKVPRGRGGALDVKTVPNNAEEQILSSAEVHKAESLTNIVYVINKNGRPLMPCNPAKARHLIEAGKAKTVNGNPFTIQLLWDCEENVQKIVLGVDSGFKHVGYSGVTETKELIAGELNLRTDIMRLLEKRSAFRKLRRSRLWYRESRWWNRAKGEDWLAPSIQHKFDSHVKLIKQVKALLPVSEIIIEVATFDQQKMVNPEISGVEYQQGELQGYNVREYLLDKWGRKCAYCGTKSVPLEIEHIVPKFRGGSNRIFNLTLACHDCNQKKGNQTATEFGFPKLLAKGKKSLKATAFMNIIRWKIVNHFQCGHTYGYVTKYWRIKEGLEKSHINDAFIIAGGSLTKQERVPAHIIEQQVRRQNRSLFKANPLKSGRWKRNTVKEVKGYRRFDKVMYENKDVFISGLRTSGSFALKTIEGEKVSDSVSSKKLKFVERARGKIQEVIRAVPLRTKVQSLPAYV